METGVLIVGAGPTGLMLANQLARRGVRPLVIDRHAGPARETRALGVHARTLEIYSKLGIVRQALELGARGTGANIWTNGKWAARVPLGDIGRDLSPFPFILVLGQDDNERLLGDALRSHGIAVQWNTELVGLAQEQGHVTATLRQPDGSARTLQAAWVAGCDGARSAVRDLNGIEFPGAPYEHVFFVADTHATGGMVPGSLNVYLWDDGFHLFFPMRGVDHWRLVGILPRELRGRDDVTFDQVLPSLRREAGEGLAIRACSWFSTYRIHHRRAARFRERRCFLLGDAAHIHSPVGAQGMNTGLQDAYNLAWKLALVVTGRADAALLDTFEQERIPVARRLLGTTDRAFSLLVSDSRLAGFVRLRLLPKVMAFAMSRERVRVLAFRTISQTGIRYRRSSMSLSLGELPEGTPQPGDRFPWLQLRFHPGGPPEDLFQKLDDTRFNLLVTGQPAPADPESGFGDFLVTHVIPDEGANATELAKAGIRGPSFFLLRPDGHVGLAGATVERGMVARYLNGIGIRGIEPPVSR